MNENVVAPAIRRVVWLCQVFVDSFYGIDDISNWISLNGFWPQQDSVFINAPLQLDLDDNNLNHEMTIYLVI